MVQGHLRREVLERPRQIDGGGGGEQADREVVSGFYRPVNQHRVTSGEE